MNDNYWKVFLFIVISTVCINLQAGSVPRNTNAGSDETPFVSQPSSAAIPHISPDASGMVNINGRKYSFAYIDKLTKQDKLMFVTTISNSDRETTKILHSMHCKQLNGNKAAYPINGELYLRTMHEQDRVINYCGDCMHVEHRAMPNGMWSIVVRAKSRENIRTQTIDRHRNN